MTVVLLVGPKGVGKSWVAETIAHRLGVHNVDADALILDLIAAGGEPEQDPGWLAAVETAVDEALAHYACVSVEATGAWGSDFVLAEHLESKGQRVIRILLQAPEEETIERLRGRTTRKVLVSESEARRIYAQSAANTAGRFWHLMLDLTGETSPELIVTTIGALLDG